MRITRNRYQQGSIRKVRRATGFAWEFRFYVNEGGNEKTQDSDLRWETLSDGVGGPEGTRSADPPVEQGHGLRPICWSNFWRSTGSIRFGRDAET